ncbi:aldo/keto reductase [Cognatishimia sp. SS12]|uniref:aldo/keto reductase n=1 Tax=Cognatishimia sp. SS12 TaxID=2979465 RepID=UPI00232C92AC|nr:aldo/keto reductase [Cognatishimia sp. SS12]MDC0739584.1 aldo/keto reductase [Cognatishimia sp. SS12]
MLPTNPVGSTDLNVTQLAFGCVPLGNYPTKLSDAEAMAALDEAFQQGIRYFDVAPLYGHGLAEHRLGAALRNRAERDFVTSTKVGRLLQPASPDSLSADNAAGIFEDPLPFSLINNYTYDGIMRSVEDSIQRLGIPSIDILHIHNIDPANHDGPALEAMFSQCMSDGYRALEQLRSEGTVKALGVGNNSLTMLKRFNAEGDFDCYMMAGHYHLLDQAAGAEFLATCAAQGRSILLGSPFASGLLVAPEPAKALYMYQKPSPEILSRLESIRDICNSHGVSMTAAALQFPLRHKAVASVVPGMRTVAEVRDCATAIRAEVPDALWSDLAQIGIQT